MLAFFDDDLGISFLIIAEFKRLPSSNLSFDRKKDSGGTIALLDSDRPRVILTNIENIVEPTYLSTLSKTSI